MSNIARGDMVTIQDGKWVPVTGRDLCLINTDMLFVAARVGDEGDIEVDWLGRKPRPWPAVDTTNEMAWFRLCRLYVGEVLVEDIIDGAEDE